MSDDTKALVRSTALRLFRERGYAATTMRAIAQEAGVATGNAYYHFASKDHLVQELYLDVTREHAAAARAVLAQGGDLTARLRGVMLAGVDAFAEYHAFGAEFVTVAIRPGSAASPFSAESGESRELSQGVFRELVEGASPAVPDRPARRAARAPVAGAARGHALLGLRRLTGPAADADAGRGDRAADRPAGPAVPAAGPARRVRGRAGAGGACAARCAAS